jgi:hypothetical protein
MKITGDEELRLFVEAVKAAVDTHAGAAWEGGIRPDGLGNSKLIEYLADGGRDLSPNDEDATAATNAYATDVLRHIDLASKSTGKTANPDNIARAGIVGGLRKGITLIADRMRKRLEKGEDNKGRRTPVKDDYAKARQKKHGVNKDAIYVATGHLADAMQSRNYKIYFGKNKAGKAARILKLK